MSTILVPQPSQASKLESVLIQGDLSKLSEMERVSYYKKLCESVGFNELTRPLEYITLNGKLTLYAKRDATDQLRKLHNVSVKIVNREQIGDVFIVTAQASLPSGRLDESIGAVQVGNLKGDMLANALMKCETKAKRRVTLSICGLGLLDETEVETIPVERVTFTTELASPVDKSDDVISSIESDLSDYVIPIGKKYKDKKLSEVPPDLLANFTLWLEDESHKKNEPIKGKTLEFINNVYQYFKEQGYTGLD